MPSFPSAPAEAAQPQAPAFSVAAGSALKLWRVQLERTLYVLAKDEREAETVAERNEREECGNDVDFLHATVATDITRIPEEWRGSLPYAPWGHKEEKTIAQLLSGPNT